MIVSFESASVFDTNTDVKSRLLKPDMLKKISTMGTVVMFTPSTKQSFTIYAIGTWK